MNYDHANTAYKDYPVFITPSLVGSLSWKQDKRSKNRENNTMLK